MKIGDLVRHRKSKFEVTNKMPIVLVLETRYNKEMNRRPQIKILEDGYIYWDLMSEYEVVSENR